MKSFSSTLATLILSISSLTGLAIAQGSTPTLVSITLSPDSVTVFPGDVNDMQVIGTYNDGSTQDLSLSSIFTEDNPAALVFGSEPAAAGGYPMFYMNPGDPAVSPAPVTITATYSDGTHSFTSTGTVVRLTGGGTSGFPTFSTQDGGPFDFINPATDMVNMVLPVRQKNGTVPFNFSVGASSGAVPYTDPDSGITLWKVTNNVTGTSSVDVHLKYLTRVVNCGGQYYYVTEYYGFSVLDPSGAVHPLLPGVAVANDVNAYRCSLGKTAEADTNDGSGYHASIDATKANKGTVYDHAGNIFTYADNLGSMTMTTPNGNTVNKVVSGTTQTYTDSLNQTVLVASLPVVTSSSVHWTYKYQDSSHQTWQSYTVTFASYSAKTNYGCSSVHDLGVQRIYLPTSISVPGGGSYSLTYEHPYNNPGNGTWGPYTDGRLEKLTLPTGGSTSYTYGGTASDNSHQGINCTDLTTVPVVTRTVLDNVNNVSGVWEYDDAAGIPTSLNETVSVKDPASNHEVYQFSNAFKTDKKVYQGAVAGTPLTEEVVCYNGNTSNCPAPSPAPVYPLSQIKVSRLRNGTDAGALYVSLDSTHGLPTVFTKYDVGAVPISSTKFFYGTWNTSTQVCDTSTLNSAHIFSTLCYFQTLDSQHSNAIVATTFNTLDNSGNLLEEQKWVSGSGYLRTFFTYNGKTVHTITDPSGGVSTFAYDGTNGCNSVLPTSVSTSPVVLSSSQEYDCYGGVVTKSTGPNGTPSTFVQNNPLWRLTSATDQGYPATNYQYADPNHFESYMNFNGSVSTVDTTTATDGLGRPILVQRRQNQGSSTFDSVQYQYGWNSTGAFVKQSLPYSSSPVAWTTTQYDAAGRVSSVTDGGVGTVTYTYNGNDVLQVASSPSIQKQLEYDGLGRLTSVCEITSGTTPWPPVTCGQANSKTGYWTKYAYNALGDLTGVTQNALGSATQTRSYYYDGLRRLTKEVNPESGTKNYFYDSDSTMCGDGAYTSSGDLVKMTDAAGNCTLYLYDALHRLTDVGDNNDAVTPCKRFRYDNSQGVLGSRPAGVTVSNTMGRLVEVETDTCALPITQATIITDRWLSYSPRGAVTDIYSSTRNSGGYYHLAKTYWENGAVKTLAGIPGVPTITYGVDGEGRPSTVSAASGQNPVTNTLYNPAGQVTSVTFGSSDSDGYTYDSSTGRMTQYTFNVNGQSVIGKPTWNSNGTLQKLQITQDPFNTANVQTCTYGYDGLSRVSSANCGSVWNQTFAYDPFGNITKNGSITWAPNYTAAKNQYQSGWNGVTYDNNGNLTYDTFHHYQWDADGHPVVIDGTNATYDALGNLAEQDASWGNQEYLEDENRTQLGGAVGQGSGFANIPLPGGGQAWYSQGAVTYVHADWLGSERLRSNATRGVVADAAFGPFGEAYASTNSGEPYHFAGYALDFALGLYDTPNREYQTTQGRWVTPDPAGQAAATPMNPQSWNKYAYVLNNPLSFTDPLGLVCVWDDGSTDDEPSDGGATYGDCEDQGGTWIDRTEVTVNGDQPSAPTDTIENGDQIFPDIVLGPANDGNPCPAKSAGALGLAPHGFGVLLNGEASGGVAVAGGTATGGYGSGVYVSNDGQVSAGGLWGSGGAALYAGSKTIAAPQQSKIEPFVLGAYAGSGGGVYVTNGQSQNQLKGPFAQWNASIGLGPGYSFSFAYDNTSSIWIFSVTNGPGVGISGSAMTTNTATDSPGCK